MIDLQGSIVHIHGPPKCGKTTLASSFPSPLRFLATEPGHRFLPEKQQKLLVRLTPGIDGWKEFRSLTWHHPKIKTYVIDVFPNLYDSCRDFVSKKEGVDYPSEGAHGKVWNAVRREFSSVLSKAIHKIQENNATLITIDHTEIIEITTSVEIYNKFISGMPGQARKIWLPIPDYVCYYGFDSNDSLDHFSNERNLYIGGNNTIEAGNRNTKLDRVHTIEKVPLTDQYNYILSQLNGRTQ